MSYSWTTSITASVRFVVENPFHPDPTSMRSSSQVSLTQGFWVFSWIPLDALAGDSVVQFTVPAPTGPNMSNTRRWSSATIAPLIFRVSVETDSLTLKGP